MDFDVDPRFKETSERARIRKSRRLLWRGLVVLAGFVCLGGAFMAVNRLMQDTPSQIAESVSETETLTMVEGAQAGIIAAHAPFIDLPKDPLILNLSQDIVRTGLQIAAPPTLDHARVGPAGPDQLAFVQDELVVQTTRLIITIPSSRADLAFFQAARGQALDLLDDPTPAIGIAPSGDMVTVDGEDGSWGALLDTESQIGATNSATYVQTTIQNTTSNAMALREIDRRLLYQDDVIIIRIPRDLDDVLQTAGISAGEAGRIMRATTRLFQIDEILPPSSVIALRLKPQIQGNTLLQMSIYADGSYVGTLVQIGPGRFTQGTDPWLNDDLLNRTQDVRAAAAQQQEIRLLDAIYSASIRNGMPTTLVGELIVMLSQHADLDRFAAVGDDISILFSSDPGQDGRDAGQLLYAGIDGPSGTIECYVVQGEDQAGFECHRPRMMQASAGGVGAGLIVPVAGTKTSDFGPRMHPILRQMRNHNGVDWGAPTGTPVYAAADGVIATAGNGGGYGNVIYINHSGARQTRYAHLNAFSDGIRAGAAVIAGDLIGYVGTTGRSTGPHLHFELHVNGVPVDPLTYEAPNTTVTTSITQGGAAVEALVNQIIRVESGGNANAANPLSSARGLGQFIESTWLRMMAAYRPDLARSMSRVDLLNLRFNPEMSREMVRNLARESEAYLRARGHQITAGRLYLAHFLGAEGAHVALSADPNRLVSQVMGNGVVNANPFLRGDSIGDLWSWADRKMGTTSDPRAVPIAPRAAPINPEVQAYIETIDSILNSL